MSGSRRDQAVEQVGVFDIVASTERTDEALNVVTTVADVFDKLKILVLADLLDTDEHGCWPAII